MSSKANWEAFLIAVGRTAEEVSRWTEKTLQEELDLQGYKGAKKGDVEAHWKMSQKQGKKSKQVSNSISVES
jgi:hypothetical protein